MATDAGHIGLPKLRLTRTALYLSVVLLLALGAGFLGGRLSVEKGTPAPIFVAVPNVGGMTAQQATAVLMRAGLHVNLAIGASNSSVAQGHIVSRLRNGSAVQIIMSVGPPISSRAKR